MIPVIYVADIFPELYNVYEKCFESGRDSFAGILEFNYDIVN